MASDEEQDVFEITDYTTASDWERFIASIEEIIHEWKLPGLKPTLPLKKGDFQKGLWNEVYEEINFSGFPFVVTYHSLKTFEDTSDLEDSEVTVDALNDMMATTNDFCSSHQVISQWYGLRNFVVIAPARGAQVIANESRAKLLLSSICIAINNTGCRIPVFIQIHQRHRNVYLGVYEGKGIRTHFNTVHLRKTPQHSSHLAGLLDVFKSKLGCQFSTLPPISVSICFTYILRDWDHSASWPQQPPDFESVVPAVGSTGLGSLPFGSWEDPINEILLSAVWPRLTEDVVVDNNVCSDLDPIHAPLWCVRVQFTADPTCLLGEYLKEFGLLCNVHETTDQLLGIQSLDVVDDTNLNIVQALDRLASPPVPVLNTMVPSRKRRSGMPINDGPIPEPKLKEILFFLFPDALGEKPDSNVSEEIPQKPSGINEQVWNDIKESLKCMKSAPVNSLLHFLAICMCHVNHTYGRVCAVAHLWHEFVLEMRHRWENSVLISGIEMGQPNLSTCLLHQKLQMLNYCIERKKLREVQQRERKSESTAEGGESSSEDEFYECFDDPNKNSPSASCNSASTIYLDSLNHLMEDSTIQQPNGRLLSCNDLKLIKTGETLYIPVTQEPAPMTEDQLEQHSEVLVQLGTDEEGVQLRAQMQSACLLSDMQAFKAANPGCVLEDFVRWYSPRDWIEDDSNDNGKQGHLSSRMLVPGNLWQEVWHNAKPIPVRRQRRLFDDTKEGEKVLHFLSSMSPADIVLRLMPMAIHAAILILMKNVESTVPVAASMIQSIAATAAKLTVSSSQTAPQYKEIIDHINVVEAILSQSKALKQLFQHAAKLSETNEPVIEAFVKQLMDQRELYMPGGSSSTPGKWLLKLFQEAGKEDDVVSHYEERTDLQSSTYFPSTQKREYILRCCVSRPAVYSTRTPQRMYASLSDGDFRLAGAFSQDTTFQ